MMSKQRLVFGYFWLCLQNNNQLWIENSKMPGLKDCKSCQESFSLSLAKKKLAKKKYMEVFQSIKWGHVCFHIPHKSQKILLFWLPYLEYNFTQRLTRGGRGEGLPCTFLKIEKIHQRALIPRKFSCSKKFLVMCLLWKLI